MKLLISEKAKVAFFYGRREQTQLRGGRAVWLPRALESKGPLPKYTYTRYSTHHEQYIATFARITNRSRLPTSDVICATTSCMIYVSYDRRSEHKKQKYGTKLCIRRQFPIRMKNLMCYYIVHDICVL